MTTATPAPQNAPYAAALLPSHTQVVEARLALSFHPERLEDRHDHPLRGLSEFGPYSSGLLASVQNPIRVAVIAPADGHSVVEGLVAELGHSHRPIERTVYLVDYKGFQEIFGVRVVVNKAVRLTIGDGANEDLLSAKPHIALADRLVRALNAAKLRRDEFDVLLVYLPGRWAPAFYGSPDEDFDLHDFLKAHAASAGIPMQIVREDGAIDYRCRCSVAWRLGIALYTKAGGIPWKLADMPDDTAYIGLAYTVSFDGKGQPTFLTCCCHVFDHDGTGLEFLAYETPEMQRYGDNPYLTRGEMRRVMARSLAMYQSRHAGRSPRRIVVHKLLPFKPDEVEGCFDALGAADEVELVQIQQDAFWRGGHLDAPVQAAPRPARAPRRPEPKSKAGYACQRGSCLMLGGHEALLWTQGNVPQQQMTGGVRDYFKEGKGTPKPVVVRRFAGTTGMMDTCRAVLALTKMNWNNDALYDRLPVTLGFASTLARTIRRMPSLSSRPYDFRFFM